MSFKFQFQFGIEFRYQVSLILGVGLHVPESQPEESDLRGRFNSVQDLGVPDCLIAFGGEITH
jgi:hypothetical protein